MAQKFEGAYRTKLTEAQARKVVSDIYQEIHGEQLFHASVRRFFTDWIANRKAELQPGAHKRYENAVDKLLRFLADRADRDIAYVHKRDITALRDTTATNLSASTANTDLKILRSAFKQAVSDGLRLDNPATAVSELTDRKALNDPERRQLPRNVRRASSKACLHARSSDSVRTFMTHASARVAACGKTRLPQQ
jgi:site-specific recombinase XerD